MKLRWIERISILLLFVISYGIAIQLDLMEKILAFIDSFETVELDEFIPTAIIMCVAFAVISGLRLKRLKKLEKQNSHSEKTFKNAKVDYEIIENLISLQLAEVKSNAEKPVLQKLSYRLRALKVFQKLQSEHQNVNMEEYINTLIYNLIDSGNPGIQFSIDLETACTEAKISTSSGIIVSEIIYSIRHNTNNSPNPIKISISNKDDILIKTEIPQDRQRYDVFDISFIETLVLPLQGNVQHKHDSQLLLIRIPFQPLKNCCCD